MNIINLSGVEMYNRILSATDWQDMTLWMDKYIKSFYNENDEIQQGILTKEFHTKQVVDIAGELAAHLKMNPHDILLAKITALFHDVGRFHQFSVYKTFNDAISENHALLGLKIMRDIPCIKCLDNDDAQIITFAIRNHNAKQIEATADKRKLYFAKLIRDADKLDIFRVLRPYLTTSDEEPCSAAFIRQFQNGGQCDYYEMRTQNDRKLVRLLWIYDVNFAWTLDKIISKGYVDEIIHSLPQTADMKKGFNILHTYISKKLSQKDELLY